MRPVRGPTRVGDDPTHGYLDRTRATAPPTFSPGTLLGSRYRIVRFIAQGGMGEVYDAEDAELGTHVALKTIRPGIAANESVIDRFKREILLARRVTHPNVCRIFDLGRHRMPNGTEMTFLTMELLGGESLAARIARGRLPVAEAEPIALQMAAGLGAAHRAGVVHRDFKPGNVMLVPDGAGVRAVVSDFGLARGLAATEATPTTATASEFFLGTPAYVSPEQADGAEVTAATDIYALGIVLFETVTGTLPFAGESALTMVVRRLKDRAPSPRTVVPDLPARWETVILRCLEREPKERYATADDVGRALQAPITRSEQVIGAFRPWRRWKRRAPPVLGAALAVALGIAGGWAWVRAGRPGAPVRAVTASQVTTSNGLDLHPSFSPDGRLVAYSSDRSGAFELWVREVAESGRDRQVTADGALNFEPAISPDGTEIAYHSKGNGGIWRVPVAGGTPQRLTTFGSRPAWSPSGRQIAFQAEALVDVAPNAVGAMPPSSLWVVAASGGSPVAITQAGSPSGGHGSPAWFPDEKHLVFATSDRRTSSLWTVSVDGNDLSRIETKQLHCYDPVVAPDGHGIYYAAVSPTGHFGLWQMPMLAGTARPGGEAVRIADLGLGAGRHLAMARDGKRIAYSALQLTSNLQAVPFDGSRPPRSLTSENGRNSRPSFSPDGRRVAFEKWRTGSNPDLWVMDADGRNAQALTSDPAIDTTPAWTPDGMRLIYRSDRLSGKPTVWSVDVKTGLESMLYDPGQDLDWPRLSPDGRELVFHSRKGGTINLWSAPVSGGPPRQLTFDSQSLGFPCWSPDGTLLAAQLKRGEDTEVAIVARDGGTVEPLTRGGGQNWPYSFSADGSRVLFAGLRGGYWNLFAVTRADGREEQITRNQKLSTYVRYPALSPDGTTVVYEYAETVGNVWMLENVP